MKLAVAVLVVAFLVGSIAAPAKKGGRRGGGGRRPSSSSTDACATRCTGVNNKFQYKEGKTYIYNYEGETKILLKEDSSQETSLKQKAKVHISNLGDCEYSLKLSEVTVAGHSVSREHTQKLESVPLRFAFDDGLVRSVCPSPEDEASSANIKRAILSAIQNSQEGSLRSGETDEKDISGKCPTTYTKRRDTVTKRKDLVNCQNHRGIQSALKGVNYDLRSKMQNSPLMRSKQSCEQKFSRNILQSVTCTEEHTFSPVKEVRNAGAEAQTSIKLTFVSEQNGRVDSTVGPRKELYFDHSEFENQESSNANSQAQHVIRQLCQTSNDDVRPETPGLFTELVYALRKMSYSDLKNLREESSRKSVCANQNKFFMDAVPMCGSQNCVKLMSLVFKEGRLSEKEQSAWYMSLSLISKPSLEMVESLSPYITSSPSARLGVSSLIRAYCVSNPDCADEATVTQATDKLVQELGASCASSNLMQQEKIVVSLKALGNIGSLESVIPKLVSCFQSSSNPLETRLAAIQALRRSPCKQQTEQLMTLFKTQDADVELRLNAFMVAMQCPSVSMIEEIKETLETEPINQVTSYVWSFLKERKSSSNPQQQRLSALLRHTRLSHKFNRDPRRFSRFYEFGSFSGRQNYGGHADAAWIFSPDSYIPRQGFMNLTLHLFGTSFNLLEIGGRTEGIDHLLHKFYGPDGYFTDPNSYLMKEAPKKHSNRRIQKFEDFYKKEYPVSKRDEVSVAMYMKVFGDEIAYKRWQHSGLEQRIQESMDLEKILEKMRDAKDINIAKNVLFLDAAVTIPTSSGIPLRLSLNGTASLRLQFQSEFNVANFGRGNMQIKASGNLVPMAAVELSSMLSFQTADIRSGVKMVSRMHTSNAMKGSFEIGQGKVRSKLELPKQKMEILQVRSQLVNVRNNVETVVENARLQRKERTCTPDSLGKLTGLRLCQESQVSRNLPYSGPFVAGLTLEKADPSLQSYVANIDYSPSPAKTTAKLEFNTPGSTVDRQVTLELEHEPSKRLTAQLRFPGKHLALTGTLNRQGAKQTGRLSLTVDRKDTYALSASLETTGNQNQGLKYDFTGEALRPSQKAIKITGQLLTPGSVAIRRSLEFKIENLYSSPVEGKLAYDMSRGRYSKINLEGKWRCPSVDMDLTYAGGMEKDGGLNYKINYEYKRPEDSAPHRLLISQTQKVKSQGNNYELVSNSNFESSWFPKWNSASTFTLKKQGEELLETRFVCKYQNERKTFEAHHVTRKDNQDKYTTDLNVQCSDLGLNHKAKIIYLNKMPREFLTSLELDTPKMKDVKMEARMKQTGGRKFNLEAEAKLEYPGREMRLFKTINEVRPKEFETNGIVQWQRGQQMEMKTKLKLKSQRGNIDYEIDAEAKKSGQPNPVKMQKALFHSPQETRFSGSLTAGGKKIYDTTFNVKKAGPKKQEVKVTVKSEASPIDYTFEGSLEQHRRFAKILFTVLEKTEACSKGEFIIPTSRHNGDKRVKGHIEWDVNKKMGGPYEIMVNYQKTSAGKDRTHTFNSKIRYGQGHNYVTDLVVKKQQTQYSFSLDSKKNGRPMIESAVMIKHPDGMSLVMWFAPGFKFESSLKTHAPLTPQHYTANFVIDPLNKNKHGIQLGGLKAVAEAKCHKSGNKMGFNFEYGSNNPNEWSQSKMWTVQKIRLYANYYSYYASSEVLSLPNRPVRAVSEGKISWAAQKEITSKSEYELESLDRSAAFKLAKLQLTTPFAKFTDGAFVLRRTSALTAPKKVYKWELVWNQKNKIEETVTVDIGPGKFDVETEMTTTFDALKSSKSKLLIERPYNFELGFEWNSLNKLRIHSRMVPEGRSAKMEAGFEGKIQGSTDVEGKITHKPRDGPSGTDEFDAMFRSEKNTWSVDGEVNVQNSRGKVQVSTPSKNYKEVTIEIERKGNGYTFKTSKGSEDVIQVDAEMINEVENKQLSINVDKIENPFAFEVQFSSGNERVFKIEATLSPNSPTKKVYGLSATADDNGAMLKIRHPKREMWAKYTVTGGPRYSMTFEVQTNAKSGRDAPKLEIAYEGRRGEEHYEVIFTDPALRHPIKTLVKTKLGCQNPRDCERHMKTIVDTHGGNKDKLVTVKLFYHHKQEAKQMTCIWGAKVENKESDLHVKSHFKLVREMCGPDMCQVTGELLAQFKERSSRNKELKQFSLEGSANLRSQSVTLKAITPQDTWTAQSDRSRGKNVITVSQDGRALFEVVLGYNMDPDSQSFPDTLEIARSAPKREVLMHLSARLLNKDHFRFRLWHSERGQRIDDAEISVKLSQADLLTTKLYLRPGLDRELSHVMGKAQQELRRGSPRGGQRGEMSQLYGSLKQSQASIGSQWSQSVQPLFNHWQSEKEAMSQDMGPMAREVQEKVELYVVMAREALLAALDVIDMTMQELFSTSPSETVRRAYDSMGNGMSAMSESVSQMLSPLRDSVSSMSRSVSSFNRAITRMVEDAKDKTNWRQIERAIDEVVEEVKKSPIVRQIIEWLMGLKREMENMDYGEMKETVKDYYDKAEKEAKKMGKKVEGVWQQWKETVMEYELGRVLVGYLKEAYGKMKYTYNTVNPRRRAHDAVDSLVAKLQEMTGTSKSWKEMMPRVEKNPEEGIFKIHFPLPSEVSSLEELGNAFHPRTLVSIKDKAQEQIEQITGQLSQFQFPEIPESAYEASPHGSIFDYLDSYQPQWKPKDMTPPFKSRAVLVGNQHFVTFDGKTFDFKANCEYLLARDFHEGKFLISAKFGNHKLDILKVETNGAVVELQRDGIVKVNGREQELPWQKMDDMSGEADVMVKRKDHSAVLKTSDGIKVRCDFYYHSCSIKIAGHYHGKSRGLLGTNDNEPSNDFMTSEGKVTENVEEFAGSWSISGSGCNRNAAVRYNPRQSPAVCEEFFKARSSPFRPCFQTVSPVPFFKMCSVYVTEMGGDRRYACNVSNAYIQMCRFNGIRLDQSSECIECDVYGKGTLTEGQEAQVEASGSPKIADVVFVVDESQKILENNKMDQLAQKVKTELQGKQLRNIQFGLVGFGGQGVHRKPHFHTGGSQILIEPSDFAKAVENLDYSRVLFAGASQEPIDPMEAMSAVATYFPFRSASQKIAILVTDTSKCEGKKVDYYDLQNDLLSGGITFHIITNEDIELEDESSENVIGLDAKTLYAGRGKADLTSLRASLSSPHSSCTALAQETDGTVFTWTSSKAQKVEQVMPKKVAHKSKGAQCQVCECQLSCSWTNTPRTFCHPCETPRPVSLTNGGSSFFNIPYLKLKAPKNLF